MADGSALASVIGRVSQGNGPDPLIGRVINDRFKIVSVVARGTGMGKVYRAEQSPLGRTCALKVLNPKYGGDHDPEFHKRFFLEASIASKLTHPNTVTIFDYGRSDDDIYYMAMEYLEGQTLHRAIREDGAFPEERAAHIARQICRSLREAHSLGVIHRDLKPANIFLMDHADERDFVKVLDFGLVKNVGENRGEDLTQAGLFMGSPKYMAPEQIKGDKVDARTDIYSLGIMLYEMIVGKVPFDRPNSVHIMMAHVNETPAPIKVANPKARVSPATEQVVMRCLEKDPERRHASMEALLKALKVVGAPMANVPTNDGMITSGEFLSCTGSSPGATSGASHATPDSQQPLFMAPTTGQNGPISRESSSSGRLNDSAPGAYLQGNTNRNLLIGAIVAMVVLIIVGIAMIVRTEQARGLPAPVAPAVSAPIPVLPEKSAKFHLETIPAGAMVEWAGRKVCDSTPCDITFKAQDSEPSKEHHLVISKDGYQPEVKTIKLADKSLSVTLIASGKGPRPAGSGL